MHKADPLIRTKLRLPFTRPGLVSRPRLQEQIAQGLRTPLTLITAPAGFGKTTLVASCISACGLPVAWLSLDMEDNREGRFLRYLIAAVQEAGGSLGNEAAQLIAAAQPPPSEVVLTSLINDLDTTGGELALVLDDYQFISSQAVHTAVIFLLEHCPQSFHLMIVTRSDPPLPLARLRGRSQMVELRRSDLRFTEAEATQFLNEVMGLRLNAGSVAVLAERTEGWIAGLQMASIALQAHLSMPDREDISGFIEGFSGTNRYILDYLLEEVLAGQPPEIQRFLLFTSILKRLTAPLCDAVAGVHESRMEVSPLDSRSILEHLERANLFLVPLDDERVWYRYHHLFADLLKARLDLIYPGLAPRLHARAAEWLEEAGSMVEAVNHALAAGEFDRAARLVEENTHRLLGQGELNALMAWIEMLPAELRRSRPSLCVHQAFALMFAGRAGEVEPLLSQAEAVYEAASAAPPPSLAGGSEGAAAQSMGLPEARQLRAMIAAVRAYTAVLLGRDAEALSQGQLARELLPPDELSLRSVVAWAMGRTLQTQGRLSEARLAFEEHVRLGKATGNIWALMAGMTSLARAVQAQGQLLQARSILEEAFDEAAKEGARGRGFMAWVETGLATVLYEQNDLEAAGRLASDAIMHTRQWPNPNHLIYAYILRTRVLLARGDLQGARIAILEADQIRRSAPMARWLRRLAETLLVQVWLAFEKAGAGPVPGDPLAEQCSGLVASWKSELAVLGGDRTAPMDECAQYAALTLARVSIAAGQADEALSWLEPVIWRTRAAGYISVPVEALLLTAIAWLGKPAGPAAGARQPAPALTALQEALQLAEPGAYIRVFLDEGRPVQTLLTQWLAHANPGPLRSYAVRLLSHFENEPQITASEQAKTPPAGDLIDPLSQRELEVLHLMALGRTNQEIAHQLIVSPGTVKAHTASIYRKLDVPNRTGAVARARQLGLLL